MSVKYLVLVDSSVDSQQDSMDNHHPPYGGHMTPPNGGDPRYFDRSNANPNTLSRQPSSGLPPQPQQFDKVRQPINVYYSQSVSASN